ncbi:MAG TPA: hypothetical protein VFQ91_16910 [Bryobacteraceae bacterium]|nr:hypothetical protein [Bryobacteraceae bacterium]
MAENINLDNYADLRDVSRQFCTSLQTQASGYLETVRQLFRPAAVFGPFLIGSHKDAPRDAAVAYGQFKAFFAEVAAAKPLSLDPSLPDALEVTFGTPILNVVSYPHEITTRTGPKTISVVSPMRWVLSFPEYPLAKFLELMSAPKRSADDLRPFVVHYAALHFVVSRNPRIQALFEALRFPLQSEKVAPFGDFPFLVLRPPAGTVRPPDDVIAQVCKYSGSDVVEEIIDQDQWTNLVDPIAAQFRIVAESLQF